MYIESIQLKNFRNYEFLEIEFDSGTNFFYGDNAQGKTNILEAIFLCGTTKSHKGSRDREIIKFGEEESHIRLQVRKEGVSYRIDMHLKKNKAKGIAINGIPIKKARELLGIVNMVFFSPEDMSIIKDGPAERRRFIDMELCQLDPVYLSDLTSYQQVVNQRNHLLKDISFQEKLLPTLDIWDEQMISYGRKIIEKRIGFIEELNEIIREIHLNLTGNEENIKLVYEPDVTSELFPEKLMLSRDRDIMMKTCTKGPHRDDMGVLVNDTDIRKFGSQGQQRTAALSLKLSEIYLVKKRIKDTPVLLLDDVLSELDSSRQRFLLNSIHDIQTIMTCTGLDDFISHQFKINKCFRVIKGMVYNPLTI